MTNHWADMANSTNVVVMGANPTENHPASMAHINRARAGAPGHAAANMIVIDPRKTRTALQADKYVRHRPGTDIAFINGVVRYIINWMETNTGDQKSINFFTYLNQGATDSAVQQFFSNTFGTGTASFNNGGTANTKYGSKFTDARFLVNSAGTDYVRESVKQTGEPYAAGDADATTLFNFPKKSLDCKTQVTVPAGEPGGAPAGTYDTVYLKLKQHVAPYTTAVVAGICGCTEGEIADVAMAFINNSRCASFNPAAPGTIIHYPGSPYYRSTTMLYAMGITQHTCGAQNVKSFAVLQVLMGNAGRFGGGINALRGIHNVQGSTDMGLLYGNIPAYSANPTTAQQPSADTNGFGKYMDALWGYPLSGSGASPTRTMDNSYAHAYTPGWPMWLQQQGFYNMTLKFFGTPDVMAGNEGDKSKVDAIFSLWPKGNGDDHRVMFRKMTTAGGASTKALICWGQNPAVTEPHQGAIRDGLRNLDLLVVTDMFETETAACDRKDGSATYLIPVAAHPERAGSVTNSGRTLQWRYQARKPAGNCKTDLELLFRFAYALDQAGAFSHISAIWGGAGSVTATSVYDELYGTPYANGWDPTSATAFEDLSGTAEVVAPTGNAASSQTVTGCEWVAEKIFREMALPCTSATGGTIWIYTGAYNTAALPNTTNGGPGQAAWVVQNRAKSRDRTNYNNVSAYHGWGYAWLVNRRVLYNNASAETQTAAGAKADVDDFPMGPDQCSRLFVSTSTDVLNYSRFYRTIHRLVDVPKKADGTTPTFHTSTGGLPGRFPAHVEPYETPRTDWETWGKNSKGKKFLDLLPTDANGDPIGNTTPVGSPATYPLVLTSIRCVEHFQGGPITRNNGLNAEVEPEPWIEINSADARKYGIVDGDWVNVITARSNSTTQQVARSNASAGSNNSPASLDNFGKGFRARVGVGLNSNQRVAPGVVAIPWHWGERGLSNGSRANDLCIDAGDANTTIPESKACLCRITKIATDVPA